MKLLFATRSAGKQSEVRRVLEAAGHEVLFPEDAGVHERVEENMLEVHDTFGANAAAKAGYFARLSRLP
ncbi:MAG: non-canonical purine NTP pyrophosphatase, partial [Gemmatimonadales bacterium]